VSTGGTASAGCAGAAGGSSGNFGVVECPGFEVRTKITGVVHDPSGRVPLYNVLAFVPGRELPPMPQGAICDLCYDWDAVDPLATSLTDTRGQFVIDSAPAGTNVPLVIQVGKWRRQVVLPEVRPCQENSIDPELTRLPRTQAEGHIPQFAVTAGDHDTMECFLRRVGIAAEEFTTSAKAGRVHMFQGCNVEDQLRSLRFADGFGNEAFTPAASLLGDPNVLLGYDAVLLGCEFGGCVGDQALYTANVKAYADSGGRLFLGHFQHAWLDRVSAWQDAVSELDVPLVSDDFPVSVDMTFPKGAALAEWLVNTQASSHVGLLPIYGAELFVTDGFSPAQRWLSIETEPRLVVPALTLNTPAEAADAERCGRVTMHDFHVSSAVQPDDLGLAFPNGCVDAPLSPQELALEFLLFDLPGCVEDGIQPPLPPGGGCGP
jgi:hypothetical protein